MFHNIRKKLTTLYAVTFFTFMLLLIVILYFSLVKIMEQEQILELEGFYEKQSHDLFEHWDDEKPLSYEPNRTYFYYIFDQNHKLVHGDEVTKGFYKDIMKLYGDADTSTVTTQKLEIAEEHFLLLKKPIQHDGEQLGYIVLGKPITTQQHFFQKVTWTFIILGFLFTLIISALSYLLAGRAMVPIKKSFDQQKKFVSDASHELRTPLSIFTSSVEILESEEKNNLSPFGKELVEDLKDESLLMNHLLEDLLFLARHDHNKLVDHQDNVSLSSLLEKVGAKFSRTIPTSISFQTNIENHMNVQGNAVRLQELLYILLDNACRYTKDGTITLSLTKEENKAKIQVIDTGVGIKPEELPLIFQRFYRGDTARVRNGTGLGLAIAKTIAEQHRGTIHVESSEGHGSTFTVLLPLQ